MNLDEFKAWLDGFTERGQLDRDEMMVDFPSPDEWSTISAKLATVEAKLRQSHDESIADALLALQANAEKIKNAEGFTPDPMFMVRAEANRLAEELKNGPLNKAIVHTINFLEDVIGGE